MKNVIDKIKESFGHKEKSKVIKTKVYYDEEMSLSRYKSINKAMYDRLYPFRIWLKEQLENNKFYIEYPGHVEVEYYGSSYVKNEKKKINNAEEGDVRRIEALVVLFRDIRRFYTDSEGDHDPYKADDTKFINEMNKFQELVKKLVLKYYKLKITDEENIEIEIEEDWDKFNGFISIRSKNRFILR